MRHAQIRAGAVLLTLVMGASCSDDGDSAPATSAAPTEPPTAPEAAPVDTPVARDAVEVAIGFLDAYGAFDADRALSY